MARAILCFPVSTPQLSMLLAEGSLASRDLRDWYSLNEESCGRSQAAEEWQQGWPAGERIRSGKSDRHGGDEDRWGLIGSSVDNAV